ncbi:MAG: hypothetical protein OQJ97_07715 [Rhodospirillales bacterium]|nr:hypothetical protein [Rhodospirillales bacterium]
MKYFIAGLAFFLGNASIAFAEPASIEAAKGKDLVIKILWTLPVDLDLFLTDPGGETVYFANRKAKSGITMGKMAGCAEVKMGASPYVETIVIPKAVQGLYRVSVDFIKDCGSKAVQAGFRVHLLEKGGQKLLGQGESKVKYRLLDTVGWEFEIK